MLSLALAAALVAACNAEPPEADGPPEIAAPPAPQAPQDDPTSSPELDEPVDVEVSLVATGLAVPWDVAFGPGDRTFVTERDTGRLLELRTDGTVVEVQRFPVDATGEGGLLGLTTGPGDLLYAYYTASGDNRVVRFRPGDEPEPVITGIPKARNHNGGRVAFGPDGMLYVSTGDAGQPALSQDPASLAGKILRITADGRVPEDNPTPGSPVYALGIRNAQGLTWDGQGRLIVGEFGPDVDDALLRVAPGSNQAWGPETANAPPGARPFPDPVDVRQPPEASWSGVVSLAGGAIPQWEDDLFVASLRGQRLWRYTFEDSEVAAIEQLMVEEFGRLRQVVQAPDGSLWVLTSNRDGRGSPAAGDDRIIRLGPPR